MDASIASNPDLSSQLRFVISLRDHDGNANILHYSSNNSKRVTRSVLAGKVFAAAHGINYATTLRMTINEIFGKTVPLILYTDSKSLYDEIGVMNATTEKRLLIDPRILRESYELRESTNIVSISSTQNPADSMTRNAPSPALQKLLDENRLELTPSS